MNDINRRAKSAPRLTEFDRGGLKEFFAVYERAYEEIRGVLLERARQIPAFEQIIRAMGPERLAEQSRHSRALLQRAIGEGEWAPYLEDLRNTGQAYANMNVPFAAWFDLTSSYEEVMLPLLVNAYASDPKRLTRALTGAHRHLEIALAEIGDAYLSAKESLIAQQQRALLELSTPVLQVRDRMLILPIIGVLDTRRARQLTQQLLGAIRTNRARVVVMDITGVPAVDSKVANHLLQTVAAARLMGAMVVISGLSPEVAQALVLLGVDLEKLQTVGDLQGGIELAERLLGYRVLQDGAPLPPTVTLPAPVTPLAPPRD